MDFDRYADSKQARHHSLGGFESRTVGSDIVQEVSGPSVVSKKTASPVSIYAKVRTMDGQIKNRVIETSMGPFSIIDPARTSRWHAGEMFKTSSS